MDLLQDFVDIDSIRFFTFLASLFVTLGDVLGGFSGLLGSFS